MFLRTRLTGRRASRGQTLVETALVLPVLVLLLLLGIDFGRIFFTTIDLRNAAHEASMVGGTAPAAACAEVRGVVDRQMGRSGADVAQCGTGTSANVVYVASADCQRADAGSPCSTWSPPYPADADLRYSVRLEYRFSPVVPFVGLLTGNGMGGTIPISVENASPVLVDYEGS
jgi:Flp pilus assembly protein TadG